MDEMPYHRLRSLYGAMRQWNICVPGIINDFSVMALQAYAACSGFDNVKTPREYFDLPAIWVDCVSVIEMEIHRIQEVRKIAEGTTSGNTA